MWLAKLSGASFRKVSNVLLRRVLRGPRRDMEASGQRRQNGDRYNYLQSIHILFSIYFIASWAAVRTCPGSKGPHKGSIGLGRCDWFEWVKIEHNITGDENSECLLSLWPRMERESHLRLERHILKSNFGTCRCSRNFEQSWLWIDDEAYDEDVARTCECSFNRCFKT